MDGIEPISEAIYERPLLIQRVMQDRKREKTMRQNYTRMIKENESMFCLVIMNENC